jgi:hypothetical protein
MALQSMIFDPDLGGVVMFNGGQSSAADFDLTGTKGFFNNQLWLWDGTDWTQLFTATVPGPRGAESLAYDATRHALVLYGGNGVHGIQGDTWTLLPPPVHLIAVVSQKLHGSAGTFDVDLLLTGNPGIECRSGGANGDYTIVFSFADPLTNVGGVSVTSGTGSVNNSAVDSNDTHNYIVSLTGVTNAQVITVSLTNVTDLAGNSSSTLSASMGILVGDTTGNGIVSNTDVASIKAQVAAPVTTSNFRNDVNANGIISNTDVSTTKAQVGTSLP